MDAHLKLIGRMPGTQTGLTVAIDQWSKSVRLASDNRDHQRQPERAGADEGAGRASNSEPNRQRLLERTRVDSLPGEGGAVFARPVNMRVLADFQKQIELLSEE